MSLKMADTCERCGRDLPATSAEALICSWECTFCTTCDQADFHGKCPNCGGELLRRPRRLPSVGG